MAGFTQIVSALREQMSATLSRSDVLRPISWLIGILLTSIIGIILAEGPNWLLVLMAVMLAGAFLLYGTAYLFCLLKDRDSLRSEKYSLHKMALERGLFGDSNSGIIEGEASAPAAPVGAYLPVNQKVKSEGGA